MKTFHLPVGDQRPLLSMLQVRSPLTRVGYSVPKGSACLALLVSGSMSLAAADEDLDTAQSFEGPRLVWNPTGGLRELTGEAGARGTIIIVPERTLNRALPASLLADQMGIVLKQGLSLPFAPADPIVKLVDGVAQEQQETGPGVAEALEHYLGLILLNLWRRLGADLVSRQPSPQGLAERFVMLAGLHKHHQWTIDAYAAALDVRRDRLNVAVRRATGLSPQAYLHRELMRDACELLANSGLPVSQIGFRLGFSDPAYFNRFFARQSGQSPGRYRHVLRARRAQGDQTYAAWP